MNPVTVIRALGGAVLLLAPDAVLRALPHQQIDRSTRVFARILGTRYLAQAAIVDSRTGAISGRRWILAGAAVDAIHATTMVALALLRPSRRKLALTNATAASAFAAVGLYQARRLSNLPQIRWTSPQ